MTEYLVKNEYLSKSILQADRRKVTLKTSAKGQTTLKQLKPSLFKNRTDA